MKQENNVKKTSAKITNESNLGEVLQAHPEIAEVLLDYGLHCVGCFANSFDTIEARAKIHGMSDGEISEMVARINEVVEFGE